MTERPTLEQLRARVQKGRHREIGNWLARRVARPSAVYGTWVAVRLGASAHQVTCAALLAGLAGAAAIACGTRLGFVGGVVLLHLAFWLDHVDGQVARWRGTSSLDGVYLDYLMHHASNLALGFALGYGLAARSGDPRWALAGFAIAAGWAGLSLHNDCRYKAFFQRLKRETTTTYRIDGGSGGRPAPSPPLPRNGLAALSWLASKACEPHTVLLGLSALAALAPIAPAAWLTLWRCGLLAMAALAPALALARAARAVRRRAAEDEFTRWFQPWNEERTHPRVGWILLPCRYANGMSHIDEFGLGYLPVMPARGDMGIGVIGAGFIVRDCHLVAYQQAGFRVVGITSRSEEKAREVAALRGVPNAYRTVEELLDNPDVEVVDVAVPPSAQPGVIARILDHSAHRVRGILAQKPLAMSLAKARTVVEACEAAGVVLQVNQNMRYDQSVRALMTLINRGTFGTPVLATISMRAIPHWMPWAEGGRSLATFIMSIHHLDTFRYWLGDPIRVLGSTRPDPRTGTKFAHDDGINLYILEFANDARASAWDDVWAGPAREGSASDIDIRWRFEGTDGLARGSIGWPGWPERIPSTLDYSTVHDHGEWHSPRWREAWFPDAFSGTMAGLLCALETGGEPDIPGRDNLKTIALCETVLASAREHRVIEFGKENSSAEDADIADQFR